MIGKNSVTNDIATLASQKAQNTDARYVTVNKMQFNAKVLRMHASGVDPETGKKVSPKQLGAKMGAELNEYWKGNQGIGTGESTTNHHTLKALHQLGMKAATENALEHTLKSQGGKNAHKGVIDDGPSGNL